MPTFLALPRSFESCLGSAMCLLILPRSLCYIILPTGLLHHMQTCVSKTTQLIKSLYFHVKKLLNTVPTYIAYCIFIIFFYQKILLKMRNKLGQQFVSMKKLCSRSFSANPQTETSTVPKPFSEVPGPKSYPFVGNMLGFCTEDGNRDPTESIHILENAWTQHGDVVKLVAPIFRPNTVFLYDPDHVEQVYRAAGSAPYRPGFDALRYVRQNDPLTNQGASGLLTSNGDEWSSFR